MGVRHFCVGWDLTTLFRWCKDQGSLKEDLALGSVRNSYQMGYPALEP